ncbi:histidine phosphatase family protein [Albimonas pacifica]|uniref:Histidine phosphatase superfamily (Branch 1) n=1 Tax=Albimonas pacifica TaxID=1114924 RepID=A0A1I3F7G7_9RHOB|nr:histidine phosphatase family protein [Albimonas pacifica]SFI07128.1 Histidine phosphatase superfamily (branch 1) [Albimonas pacifica]
MTRRRTLLRTLVALAALAVAPVPPLAAQPLDGPGTILIMRHALAPGVGDPAGFRLDDPSTQRNLDETGRAQARAIGARLRAAGFVADRVLTSRWRRCSETAELLDLGPVEPFPALDSFFGRRERRAEQTEALRRFLTELPPESRVMLVTHQVNITALTGVVPRSGEILSLAVGADGAVEVLERIPPP